MVCQAPSWRRISSVVFLRIDQLSERVFTSFILILSSIVGCLLVALRSRPRPRIRARRSNGVVECWSIALSLNCTPRTRGLGCFQVIHWKPATMELSFIHPFDLVDRREHPFTSLAR